MIAVLLCLLIFSLALSSYLATEIVALNHEIRQIRQADSDDMDQLDAWVTQQEARQ